jgi:hypothetical protein
VVVYTVVFFHFVLICILLLSSLHVADFDFVSYDQFTHLLRVLHLCDHYLSGREDILRISVLIPVRIIQVPFFLTDTRRLYYYCYMCD